VALNRGQGHSQGTFLKAIKDKDMKEHQENNLLGAAVGAIAGDTGKGAAAGAVVGTMAGGRQARQNKQAQAQQTESAKAGTIQHFNKAFGACMEGKGYVVK
jgi:hypothetical protein